MSRRSTFRSAAGAYKVGSFEVGHYIEYERVKDWWGADLPVARAEQFRHRALSSIIATATSASKASPAELPVPRGVHLAHLGDPLRFSRRSRTAASSARCMPDDTPSGAQGWFINTRREKFKDARVREALIDAFDFEWTNKNIMYGAYERTHSVFQNSPMMAKGKPSAGRARAARAVPRQGAGRGVRRALCAAGDRRLGAGSPLLRKASQLLHRGRMRDQERQARDAERRAVHDRIPDRRADLPAAPSCPTSRTSACSASTRPCALSIRCSTAARVDEFDFDITVERFSFSSTPGDSLRTYFSSQAAAHQARRISPASPTRRSTR